MAGRGRGLRDPETPEKPGDKAHLLNGAVVRQAWSGTPADDQVRWAQQITDEIVNHATELHRLLHEAKVGEAHKHLGFGTWEQYVETCFHFTRQRAHQLTKHNEVIRALEGAAGVEVTVPEGHTRGMHRALDVVVKYMQEEIERGVDPYLVVEQVVAYFGRPNRKQAVTMSRVPGALSAMALQLAETDDFNRHVRTVHGLMCVTRSALPPEDYVTRLSDVSRADLARELASAERWVAQAQRGLAEAAMPEPEEEAARRRRTPPPPIRRAQPVGSSQTAGARADVNTC